MLWQAHGPYVPKLDGEYPVTLTRRALMGTTIAGLLPVTAHAQRAADALPADKWAAMLKPAATGDHVLGKDDAPVTIVEYASITCVHCKNFHEQVMPKLKEKYIDTGKVRLIFREMAFDALAMAGFMLANCAGKDAYFPLMGALFSTVESWGRAADPAKALLQVVKQAGFTQESFEACLRNKQVQDNVSAVGQQAMDQFGVTSTPTFFINGTIVRGASSFEEFEKNLAPHIKN